MRVSSAVLLLSLMALRLGAQHPSAIISPTTAEGRLLQQIVDEADNAKKVSLAEQFLAQNPGHQATPWLNSEILASLTKLGQFDKAMAAAEKLLAQDPADLEPALLAIKAAEGKKDPDAMRKWAILSSDMARKVIQAPKPQNEDEQAFKRRVDFARELDTYTEYALYAAAVQASEPARKIELMKTLEQRAPESQYLFQDNGLYFLALLQTGDLPAAVVVAEKVIAKGHGTEEMLAAAADFYLRQNKEPQKVLDYSSKLLEMANTRPKPDGVSDADWQKRKNYFLGFGQWLTGALYSSQGKSAEADKVLRAALPLLEGNDQIKAGALYNLGLVNHRLKNVDEATKFYEQCIAIQSPYQPLAAQNLKTIRSAVRIVK